MEENDNDGIPWVIEDIVPIYGIGHKMDVKGLQLELNHNIPKGLKNKLGSLIGKKALKKYINVYNDEEYYNSLIEIYGIKLDSPIMFLIHNGVEDMTIKDGVINILKVDKLLMNHYANNMPRGFMPLKGSTKYAINNDSILIDISTRKIQG